MIPPPHMTEIEAPLGGGPCVVLRDPETEHKCGFPTKGKHVLDYPICDECHEAVRI